MDCLAGSGTSNKCCYGCVTRRNNWYGVWICPCGMECTAEEKNSVTVRKCALRSPDLGYGALYVASTTGLIGTGVTAYGFFKNPSIRDAKDTMALTAIGAGIV